MITDEEIDEIEEEIFLEDMSNKKEVKEVMEQFELAGYKPELVTDDDGFKPIVGKYICRIVDLGIKKGTNNETGVPYSFPYLKAQVVETVEGDKGTNRYLDRSYWPKEDKTALQAFVDDLHTAGLPFIQDTEDNFFNSLQALRDKSVNIRAWSAPKMTKGAGDKWIPAEGEEKVQRAKIVKEFKSKKKTAKAPF